MNPPEPNSDPTRQDLLHFDRIAACLDDSIPAHVREHLLNRRATLIKSLLPDGRGRVVDFGCGTGHLVHRLREKGVEADGLDSSSAMIELSRRGPGNFFLADGTRADLPSDNYDMAVSIGVLHYLLTDDKVAACLSRMAHATRPGGLVLVADNNPWNPYWNLLMRRLPVDCTHTRLLSSREIRRGLKEIGCKILWTRRIGWVPDFTPRALLPAMVKLEHWLERIPLVRALSAYHVIAAVRSD